MTVFKFDSSSLGNDFVDFYNNVYSKQPFLLIVIAPTWCGHCIAMEKDLNMFLNDQRRHPHEHVAVLTDEALDHLINEHGQMDITKALKSIVNGYPSISYVEAKKRVYDDNKKVKDELNIHELDEPRTREGLRKFQKKHAEKDNKKSKPKSQKPNAKPKKTSKA